jgi:dihydroorotate dehydrogenase (NAD+) catalytic subunit
VSVGTAVFGDPAAPVRVLGELEAALDERGFASAAAAVGFAHLDHRARADRLAPVAPEAAAS